MAFERTFKAVKCLTRATTDLGGAKKEIRQNKLEIDQPARLKNRSRDFVFWSRAFLKKSLIRIILRKQNRSRHWHLLPPWNHVEIFLAKVLKRRPKKALIFRGLSKLIISERGTFRESSFKCGASRAQALYKSSCVFDSSSSILTLP